VIWQVTDELVVFNVLPLDEWLDSFMEISLVGRVMSVTLVEVFGDMAYRLIPLPGEQIIVVVWTGRRARVGRMHRGNALV